MSDEKKKPERMVQMVAEEAPKPVLGSIIKRVEDKFATAATQQGNVLRAAQVRAKELAVDFYSASAEQQKQMARNAPKNIKREIKLDVERVKAELKETENKTATAKAEADQIVGDFLAKQRQSQQAEKTAQTAIMEQELKQATLEKQIREARKANLDDQRKDLREDKDKIEADLKTITTELKELLMEETEQSLAKKRVLENTQIDLQEKLAAIAEAIKKLDGD